MNKMKLQCTEGRRKRRGVCCSLDFRILLQTRGEKEENVAVYPLLLAHSSSFDRVHSTGITEMLHE